MNDPVVSIIIATYNSQRTLRTALDSVLNQTYQDWECIVVDGASKDSTVDIVKEYVAKDSRFRYISEPDKGIYDAFNKGWRMAKGEWVYYLGSDDELTRDSFIELIREESENYGVISGNVLIRKIDGTKKMNISQGFSGCHQGKIVRKSIMGHMNGFDEQYRILADLDLMIRMEKSGIRILNVNTTVAIFVMDGASQKLSNEWIRYKERVRIHKNNKLKGISEIVCAKIHIRNVLSIFYRQLLKYVRQ